MSPSASASRSISPSPASPNIVGTCWVDGDTLHYIATDQDDYFFTGTVVANEPTAVPGAMWVYSTNLYYVCSNQDIRALAGTLVGPAAGVEIGNIWINDGVPPAQQLHFVGTGPNEFALV